MLKPIERASAAPSLYVLLDASPRRVAPDAHTVQQ